MQSSINIPQIPEIIAQILQIIHWLQNLVQAGGFHQQTLPPTLSSSLRLLVLSVLDISNHLNAIIKDE